jgi:hypothetical protein
VTQDGRKFYVVDLEDLSGTVELTVWNDTIELTGEEIWAEGRVLVCSIEVRDRGDRVGLNVRKAAPYDAAEGSVVGFIAEQWQVEAPKRRPRMDQAPGEAAPGGGRAAPANGYRPNGNGNGNGYANGQRTTSAAPNGGTTEASRPGVTPPVSGDSARLTVTIFETRTSWRQALLRAVAGMLKDSPGKDESGSMRFGRERHQFDLPRRRNRGPRPGETCSATRPKADFPGMAGRHGDRQLSPSHVLVEHSALAPRLAPSVLRVVSRQGATAVASRWGGRRWWPKPRRRRRRIFAGAQPPRTQGLSHLGHRRPLEEAFGNMGSTTSVRSGR